MSLHVIVIDAVNVRWFALMNELFHHRIPIPSTSQLLLPKLKQLFYPLINLQLIFLIIWLIFWSTKCQKIGKNVHHNFPEPKLTSLNYLFCPTNPPKPKCIQLNLEIQQIVTYEKLEWANGVAFLIKNDFNSYWSSELLQIHFLLVD